MPGKRVRKKPREKRWDERELKKQDVSQKKRERARGVLSHHASIRVKVSPCRYASTTRGVTRQEGKKGRRIRSETSRMVEGDTHNPARTTVRHESCSLQEELEHLGATVSLTMSISMNCPGKSRDRTTPGE